MLIMHVGWVSDYSGEVLRQFDLYTFSLLIDSNYGGRELDEVTFGRLPISGWRVGSLPLKEKRVWLGE